MKKSELKKLVKEVLKEEISSHGGNLHDDMSQVKRWMNNPHWQNFLRQIHVDIYVGLKNGVSEDEIKGTVQDFLIEAEKIMIPKRIQK